MNFPRESQLTAHDLLLQAGAVSRFMIETLNDKHCGDLELSDEGRLGLAVIWRLQDRVISDALHLLESCGGDDLKTSEETLEAKRLEVAKLRASK